MSVDQKTNGEWVNYVLYIGILSIHDAVRRELGIGKKTLKVLICNAVPRPPKYLERSVPAFQYY